MWEPRVFKLRSRIIGFDGQLLSKAYGKDVCFVAEWARKDNIPPGTKPLAVLSASKDSRSKRAEGCLPLESACASL